VAVALTRVGRSHPKLLDVRCVPHRELDQGALVGDVLQDGAHIAVLGLHISKASSTLKVDRIIPGERYRIVFISSDHGGDTFAAGWGLAIGQDAGHMAQRDQRDNVSRNLFAHHDEAEQAVWRIEHLIDQDADTFEMVYDAAASPKGLQPYNEWTVGINACGFDKRDGSSQWVMVHQAKDCAGKWRFLSIGASGEYHIEFISSQNGGDRQFARQWLSINGGAERDGNSSYVMAHSSHNHCTGKWALCRIPCQKWSVKRQ